MKTKNTFSFLLVALAAQFLIVGCTRPDAPSSKLQISIPSSMATQKIGALSASVDSLQHAVINVSGPGIASTILMEWDAGNLGPGATAPSSFTLDIPVGDSRLIQVLAVYSSGSGSSGMSFYYGDSTASLKNAVENVPIIVSLVGSGTMIGGNISGRYLTGADSGPTGPVKIKYFPPNKPSLIIMNSGIFNGWFNFFMLDGDTTTKFGYELADGKLLWGKTVNLMDPEFAPSAAVLKIAIPMNYSFGYQSNSNAASWNFSQAQEYLFGWFGPGVTTEYVCRADAQSTDGNALPGLTGKTVATATPPAAGSAPAALPGQIFITSSMPTAADLMNTTTYYSGYRVKGGQPSTNCSSGTERVSKMTLPDLYTTMLSGNGGSDNVRYHFGPFIAQTLGTQKSPVTLAVSGQDLQISGQLNTGLRGTFFDRIKTYKRVNTDNWESHNDGAPCVAIAAGMAGFVPSGEYALTNDTFTGVPLGLNISDYTSPNYVNVAVCLANSAGVTDAGFIIRGYSISYMMPSVASGYMAKLASNTIGYSQCVPGVVALGGGMNSGASGGVYNPSSQTFAVGTTFPSGSMGVSAAVYADTDPTCTGTPITSLTMPAGTSAAKFFFMGTGSGANMGSINFSNSTYGAQSTSVDINYPGSPFALQMIDSLFTLPANGCKESMLLTVDSMGRTTTAGGTLNVSVSYVQNFSPSPKTGLNTVLRSSCTSNTNLSSISLANTPYAPFALISSSPIDTDFRISVSSGSLATAVAFVNPTPLLTSLVASTPSASVYAGSCIPITLTANATVASPIPIMLSAMLPLNLYSNSTCSTPASAPLTFPAGTISTTLYGVVQGSGTGMLSVNSPFASYSNTPAQNITVNWSPASLSTMALFDIYSSGVAGSSMLPSVINTPPFSIGTTLNSTSVTAGSLAVAGFNFNSGGQSITTSGSLFISGGFAVGLRTGANFPQTFSGNFMTMPGGSMGVSLTTTGGTLYNNGMPCGAISTATPNSILVTRLSGSSTTQTYLNGTPQCSFADTNTYTGAQILGSSMNPYSLQVFSMIKDNGGAQIDANMSMNLMNYIQNRP